VVEHATNCDRNLAQGSNSTYRSTTASVDRSAVARGMLEHVRCGGGQRNFGYVVAPRVAYGAGCDRSMLPFVKASRPCFGHVQVNVELTQKEYDLLYDLLSDASFDEARISPESEETEELMQLFEKFGGKRLYPEE
jgi:hypothetical protein